MKQIRTIFLMFATVFTIMWGCSKDSDEREPEYTFTASGQPSWQVDWTWHDEAPGWQNPDPSKYESRMYVILKLNDEYVPYSTDQDRIALFLGNECRGVSGRNVDNNGIYFPIIVSGDNGTTEGKMEIRFYCAKMKQIFIMPGFHSFVPSYTIGDDSDQSFPFGNGSPKYPKFNSVTVQVQGDVPFTVQDQDMIGVFVNGECRGTGKIGQEFTVWKQQDEETCQICYYSSANAGIYTLKTPVTLTDETYNVININF